MQLGLDTPVSVGAVGHVEGFLDEQLSATAEKWFWITFSAGLTDGHRRVVSGTRVSGRGGHACA
ncbi:hypothetical protein ACFYXB_36835, partial [Streptomyces sp. NPDC002619]